MPPVATIRLPLRTAFLALVFTTRARGDEPAFRPHQDQWPLVELSVAKTVGLPVLEARSVNGWHQTPCVPPCTLRLNPTDEYRISGDGVTLSDPFRLPLGADRVRVDVSTGSTLARDVGTAFAVGGFLFAAGGGAILLLPQDEHASDSARTGKTAVGVGFLSLGVLTVAAGIAFRLFAETTVHVRPESSPEDAR